MARAVIYTMKDLAEGRKTPIGVVVLTCLASLTIAECRTAGPVPPPEQTKISREQEFRLRAECDAQAEKVIDQTEHELERDNRRLHDDIAILSSQNHYNEILNRCFVLINSVDRQTLGRTTQVLDAFERRIVVDCRGGLPSVTNCVDRESVIPGLTMNIPPEITPQEAGRRIAAMLQQ